ncbi:MAG TPA: ELWxxDGT repeat protein, partial [Pirellulales bacterium]|nr:ELWxxDGT repeat protein [Pirellulales bacterium]
PLELAVINGTLYFSASPTNSNRELYKSDGTPDGTLRIKDINPNGSSNPEMFVGVGDTVYFVATTTEHGTELWKTDGTEAGTVLVKDVWSGPQSSSIQSLTAVGDLLYFVANDSAAGLSLWRSDGTEAGTVLVKDFWPNAMTGTINELVEFAGELYFRASDPIYGDELWRSRGTSESTQLVADINPGAESASPVYLTPAIGRLFFVATTSPDVGRELWALSPVANTPSVKHAVTFAGVQSQSGLTVRRNVADGSEVSHVKVTEIIRGTLFLHDGVTQVHNGDFLPFEETMLGLKFTPEDGFTGTASFKVQASTSASDDGLGGNVVTDTITVFAGLGTDNDDTLTLRASADGTLLEVHRGNPPAPGTTPVLVWPMDASVPLPINTMGGNDKVFVELPANSGGPARGIRFERGAAADELHVTSGRLRLGGSVSVVASLTISADAAIDVADGALIVDYAATSPVTTVREKILSGRGGAGFGAPWDGTGIMSSTAAAANAVEPETWSVGYAENAALPLGPYTIFRGVPVDETSVLIAYTPTGDANLDGVVNDDDVTIIGATYAPSVPQPQWALGDFEYNGFVDDDDVTLLGAFYQPIAAAAAPPAAAKYEGQRTKYEAGAAGQTFGPGHVRGRAFDELSPGESRAQQDETRTQQVRKQTVGDNDRLIDLLSESIAATIASRKVTIDDTGLPGQLARRRLDLWPL